MEGVIRIWQLGITSSYGFLGYDAVCAMNGGIDRAHYQSVYIGTVAIPGAGDVGEYLDGIFDLLNRARKPDGYRGRSLSVSDVAEVCFQDEKTEFWYCDPFGWKKLTAEEWRV